MKRKAINYFQKLISTDNTADAKIAITLFMAVHLVITAFLATFFTFGLALFATKGSVNKDLLDFLQEILRDDMIVVISGLGFATFESAGKIWKPRNKKDFSNYGYDLPYPNERSVEQIKE